MTRKEFMAAVMHLAWASYQRGAKQEFNLKPTVGNLSSIYDQIDFFDANPTASDSANHENWMRFKIADGWKYGPVKDVEKKEHPDLVPFDQLPPEEQAKNVNSMDAFNVADRLWKEIEGANL